MFVRYLGGGIGHLEQFPPAESGDNDATTNDANLEVEIDDFVVHEDTGGNDNGDEGNEDEEVEEDEDAEEEGYLDPGELSDEETGNVY